MDLPTYTNIWRIEKRLYKLYDLRLPMPLPLVQIGVFVGVFVPWVLLLMLIGVPLKTPWHVLYLVPPGVLTWLATRPVIEGKRLTELLLSQARYLTEPRTWCRLTPIREPREVVVVARIWRRRTDPPVPAAAPARAAVRAHKEQQSKEHKEREQTPAPARRRHSAVVPMAGLAAAAPPAAPSGHAPAVGTGTPARRAARPWRPTTPRSISHESDVPPSRIRPVPSADLERPPATPRLEVPPPASGRRALASGVKRPGEAAELWPAVPPAGPQPARPQGVPGRPAPSASPASGPGTSSGAPAPARAGLPAPQVPPPRPVPAEAPQERPSPPAPPPAPAGPPTAAGETAPAAAPSAAPGTAPAETSHPSAQPAASGPLARRPEPPAAADDASAGPPASSARHPGSASEQEGALAASEATGAAAEAPLPPQASAEPSGPEDRQEAPSAPKTADEAPAEPSRAPTDPAAAEAATEPTPDAGPQDEPAATEAPDAAETPAEAAAGDSQAAPAAGEPQRETAAREPAEDDQAGETAAADGAPRTRPDIPRQVPGTTVPDIPQVPRAFGAARTDREDGRQATAAEPQPAAEAASAQNRPPTEPQAGEQDRPQMPTRPWRDGLSRPLRPARTDVLVWPPVPVAGAHPKGNTGAPADGGRPARESGPAGPPSQAPGTAAAHGGVPAAPPGGLPPAAPPPHGQTPAGPPRTVDQPPPGPAVGHPPADRRATGPQPAIRAPWPPAAAGGQPAQGRPAPGPFPQPQGHAPGRPAGAPPAGRPAQGTPFTPPPDQRVAGAEHAAQPSPPPAPARQVRSGPASPVRPRPLPPPPSPPPPSGPAITPPGPEQESTSGGGLRRLIAAVSGGHSHLDEEYQERLQRPFQGTRRIVVLGCTGGAGQTVTALMLGHTFAQYCGEPVVAIDINPGPGALARRTRSDTHETLTSLITRADQVTTLTAMRRYTSQAKSGLDVIAAGKNPLQALDDRDYALAIRTIDKFYSITLLDAAAAVVARVLPHADQIVLVAPASADAPRAVAMTFEWLDGHGYDELRSRAVTVINGVSRRSMADVEQAEAVARGRCRALVRIPWDDHLSMDRAPRNELKSLRSPTRRAYLALAGVIAGGFSELPERYVRHEDAERQQEGTV
ncbi:TcpE family conjugal transfer membrane protein [Thermomonospora sp. CIF 1]|uniref:TcpE family conjugal transfer membrane protein n=1 Tax=Thermomonospora sp. CIF 1 TaxID=1916083 RepID=UPI000A6BA7B6|nr:TcpE family conjugal transfer membrane protein [Thermomonospora sp. CIF 1]PKK15479.1 MAG: hypothetical protein BUE48_005345 [Thermomonospora sp. CIF 1]